jgi:hypothetical protein
MSKFKKPALTLGAIVLVFSLLLLVEGSFVLAEEDDFEELDTLSCKVEGTIQGEPAEFWYRIKNIGTEDEAFRLDATVHESEESMGFIMNKVSNSTFYKELGAGSWMPVPLAMVEPYWETYREDHITAIGGADDWRDWAEADQEEFVLEDEDEHEQYTVRVYDIKVDEPIEDSVFTPDGS